MNVERASKTEKLLFLAVFLLAAAVRLYRFGAVPAGLNQDEAFAAYDAWALLHTGTDSALQSWPVYLTAWGSGMNALETYLLLPLIALFGVHTWVIRLPQLLVALGSVCAAWRLGRRLGTARTGLLFALLLAVCPWHVTFSRWGLESNLAPGLLLFGLCLFLRGLTDRRALPWAGLAYGLALYAYSAIWPVMPLLLGLLLLCFRPKADRYLLAAGLIFAALALPLLAFLAVNYGLLPSFRIGPFTVPRLVEMRASDISLTAMTENLLGLLGLLLRRSDGLIWNTPTPFGLFYPISVPLALYGLGELVGRAVRALREKRADAALALLIQVVSGLCLGLLIAVNANRINFLLLPLVLCAAWGADRLTALLGRHGDTAAAALAGVYLAFFALFAHSYFTDYADSLLGQFTWGVEQAVQTAAEKAGPEQTVYVTDAVHYPKLLLLAQITPQELAETGEYANYPAPFLQLRRVGRFEFREDKYMRADGESVYILWAGTDPAPWRAAGYSSERVGFFYVLWPEAAP